MNGEVMTNFGQKNYMYLDIMDQKSQCKGKHSIIKWLKIM